MDNFSGEISHVRPVNDSMVVGNLSHTTRRAMLIKGAFRALQNCLSKPQLEWMGLIFIFPFDF